ncbi:MAG TPA: S-adenosylmethionine:tRNA ribosyltransferase-isomerase [bacterium]|nr:S-adenosylmethionine:tRNA ribosyltransferase-isomerase [bacterium]
MSAGVHAPIERFDFTVPSRLEAHEPPEARGLTRDAVRLLVSHVNDDHLFYARFCDLPTFLRPGDLVVVNVSGTLPAALTARRADGSEVAVHVSTHLPAGLVVVEFRKVTPSAGEVFALPGAGSVVALAPHPGSTRLWVARFDLPEPLLAYLARWGRPITYPYVRGTWPIEMYQNVYASVPGSAEMPSAGRPFTAEILDRLALRGIFFASIVLHTGVASLESDEPPYEEYFEVSHETAASIERAKKRRGRVIAVGTTVVRALESAVDAVGRPIATRGWTDVIITPEHTVKVVDGLLTGFHDPKATHLALLEAIAGRATVERAYRAALDAGYLWHEFGDLHLIVPD